MSDTPALSKAVEGFAQGFAEGLLEQPQTDQTTIDTARLRRD
jgi:hypothetical protein